jgi:hypothetical protein
VSLSTPTLRIVLVSLLLLPLDCISCSGWRVPLLCAHVHTATVITAAAAPSERLDGPRGFVHHLVRAVEHVQVCEVTGDGRQVCAAAARARAALAL